MKKVFTHREFEGHFPVGTAAVIVADDVTEAIQVLGEELKRIGLSQTLSSTDFHELKTDKSVARILRNGDY